MKIWKDNKDYIIVTSNKRLYTLIGTPNGYQLQNHNSRVNDDWAPSKGTLLKNIPNKIKRKVFKLNKNT